jgi:hypothetical protein
LGGNGSDSGDGAYGEEIRMIWMGKLETEFIKIPFLDLPLGAMKDHVCPFGGFARTMCCMCATMATVGMTMMTTSVTLAAVAVMVMAK